MDSLSQKYEKFVKFLKEQIDFIITSRPNSTDEIFSFPIDIEDLNDMGLTKESEIQKVCKRLKHENIIFDFVLRREPLYDYNEHPVWDKSQMVFVVKSVDLYFEENELQKFTQHKQNNSNVVIDEKHGLFIYKKIKVKFRRNSKQMNFLKLLDSHRGELVNFVELASLLMTRPVEGAIPAAVKKNIYDNFFVIKDKLKKYKIPKSIFLETNDGFGLK